MYKVTQPIEYGNICKEIQMSYERLLDKNHLPTEREILRIIGNSALWLELKQYLESSYDFTPELVNYGKHGWTIRYRKSGKTLVSLFPEKGAFTVLIVLGKLETEKVLAVMDQCNANVRTLIEEAEQLRDGRWLWIRVHRKGDIISIKKLLAIKRKPKNE